ncbi:SGT1-ecdysoneless-like protein [Rhizoctonia solani 123E]|uniref:SGT1-ecdysoneless-like protein n=1 Tax=Rhizoctonia solani 123E TaxID=1423351 RepID=A0A074S857_9AGAM|nr:SGT1-ecdysoneless-like protein [Rhizoctonia solani 123E]
MDIFKLAPQVAEDTLEYSLYPRNYDESPAVLRTLILEYVAGLLLPNFLWHRDSFEIAVQYPDQMGSKSVQTTNKWNFYGRMRVGDCVDDEWCTVWLLREISIKWDLAVSAHDTDGEFLLIEAADALPAWITPENAENRIWIYRGHLHIIPLSYTSDPSTRPTQPNSNLDDDFDTQTTIEEYLSVTDALKLIFDEDAATDAGDDVEQAAWNRVVKYPAALSQHIHRAKAYLPMDVGRALSVNPSLVQRAVEAFYTRDGLQLRAAQRMTRFPPKPDVLRAVSMTRPAYAQLAGQVFHPPKIFGIWQEIQGSPESRWRDIGMKIACGFEMMYAESKSQAKTFGGNSTESRDARMDALRRDEGYNTYIQRLAKAGYFGMELAGSQLHKEREQAAADKYVELRSNSDSSRSSFAAQVEEAVKLSSEYPLSSSGEEDSTEWLQIDESAFDGMLKQKFGRKDAEQLVEEDEEYAQEQATRLQELAKKVEGFVEGKGELEGARFEDDILDEDIGPDSDDESITSETNEADRQQAMDRLVPPLEPGDYGQMPASYSNSQPVKPSTLGTDIHTPENEEMPELGEPTPDSKPSVADTYKTPASTPQDTDQQSEQKGREKLLRRPLLPRDRFDGVDSDDDTDPEEAESALNTLSDDGESEEDRPTVVGEVEIDMDDEQEEFIKFSREALGIDDALWNKIIEERKHRGAFIPGSHTKDGASASASHATATKSSTGNEMHWLDNTPKQNTPRASATGPKARANPKLDSFEAVMEAMEAELRSTRAESNASAKPSALKVTQDKGKGKAVPREEGKKGASKQVKIADDDEHDMEDIETAMERELRGALNENENSDEDGEVTMDYNLIKNFLESFKGQAGASGPVSNLAGRLQQGWALPRDNGA